MDFNKGLDWVENYSTDLRGFELIFLGELREIFSV
jgi:hypothetical protein